MSGNCQVTTAEHQTSAVSEAEPQHENEPLTLSANKTDTPLKHSSEDPTGNVKKKVPGLQLYMLKM